MARGVSKAGSGFAIPLLMSAILLSSSAQAEVDLKGKTVTIYVAGGAGGGVDAYARTILPYFSKYLPGKPAVITSNMPGAGGAQAVQYLYNVGAKDGTAIGTTNVGPIADPFLEAMTVNYELAKLHWVGSLATGNTVCAVWHTVGVDNIMDVQNRVVTVSATGARSAPTRSALLMNSFIGTKFKPISGYTGGTALLALERGEVDATCSTLNSLRTTRPQWLQEGKLKILVHVAIEADAEYKNVPRAIDFIKDPKDKAALEFFLLPYEFQNPYYLPPGVSPEVVSIWRQTFEAAFQDKDYLSEAGKRLQDVNPKTGQAVEKLVQQMFSTPPDVVKRAITAMDPSGKVEDSPNVK